MNRSPFDVLSVFLTLLVLTTASYGELVADAGADQRAYHPNEPVILDGSGSVFADPWGVMEYQWTQVAGPDVQFSDPAACETVFVPPVEGTYVFQLVVGDGQQTSVPEVVQVTVGSIPTCVAAQAWPVVEGGNGHVYQPVAAWQLILWTQADEVATNAGGYLATITSAEESDFVFDAITADNDDLFAPMMGNLYGPWLGGYQLPGSAEPGGGWAWVTGEAFEYTAWNVGEPSNTAGGLNEDRLHYLGHGGPEPLWNDQINAEAFGPTSFVIEYDPVVCEAEEAAAISGGTLGSTQGGYSGTGYVTLDGQAGSGIQWATHMGMAGPRKVLLRYAHCTGQDVPVQIVVNGIPAKIALPDTTVGVWPAWNSASIDAYFYSGSNVVEVLPGAEDAAVSIDKVTLCGNNTNLVSNRCIITSTEEEQHPAAHALDGDPRTYWRAEGVPQWLEVDLADVYDVHSIQVTGMYDQSCRFYVEAKTHAGGAYTRIVDRTGYPAATPEPDTFEPVPARYVRLTVTGGAGAYADSADIAEFYVSAAAAPAPIAIGTMGYRTIQSAIDVAHEGDIITLRPGMYTGPGNQAIDMKGKRITLASSDPNDPDIVAHTVIAGNADAPAVRFRNNEDAGCVLAGLTLTGAQVGIYVEAASPTIRHCRIEGHVGPGLELYRSSQPHIQNCIIAGNRGAGIAMHVQLARFHQYNCPDIANCTIVENLGAGIEGGAPVVTNSIIYFNCCQNGDGQIESEEPVVTYCDVQGGAPGEGNFDADPRFVSLGFWADPDGPNMAVDSEEPDAIWISGDYHLQSAAGRWETESGTWAIDTQSSPCIDAGNPATPTGGELDPGDGCVNLGAYGRTCQASMACDAAGQ